MAKRARDKSLDCGEKKENHRSAVTVEIHEFFDGTRRRREKEEAIYSIRVSIMENTREVCSPLDEWSTGTGSESYAIINESCVRERACASHSHSFLFLSRCSIESS